MNTRVILAIVTLVVSPLSAELINEDWLLAKISKYELSLGPVDFPVHNMRARLSRSVSEKGDLEKLRALLDSAPIKISPDEMSFNVAISAMLIAAATGDTQFALPIAKFLDSDNTSLRRNAISALGELGSEDAVKALEGQLIQKEPLLKGDDATAQGDVYLMVAELAKIPGDAAKVAYDRSCERVLRLYRDNPDRQKELHMDYQKLWVAQKAKREYGNQ